MPDIVGARADAVDGLVSGLGLEPDYELVGPAPDPALSLTVESHLPGYDAVVPRGTAVEVFIYSEHEPPRVSIPDLSGRTAQKAEPVLTTIGLAPSFELAGPAPTGSLPADPCHRHPAAI